jgi:hypothetical protein
MRVSRSNGKVDFPGPSAKDLGDEYPRGVEMFNQGEYFESHEVLEAAWVPTEPPARFFLQALIHVAVSFHHLHHDNLIGAVRQMEKALAKLEPFQPAYAGLDTRRLFKEARAWRAFFVGEAPRPASAPHMRFLS